MRTLSADLLAAQRSASAEPSVDVVVENSIGGMRRLDFALLDNTAQTIAKHGVAVAGDGSVTRVRSDNAGGVLQQRVTNPAVGPWTSWTSLATGKGNTVACAAKGTRVAIVYTDAAGTGIKLRESTDSGATYAAEIAVTTAAAAVVALAVAYKNSSGDLAIAWITAAQLNIIKRASGAFGAASGAALTVSSLSGVAMCYGFDWDIVLTGVEATTLARTLWTIVHGDGSDAAAGTWGTLYVQQQAESDSSVSYGAPSVAYTDTYRINFVEADAFTGGSTRTYRTSVHPSKTFVAGANTLRTPLPVNYAAAEGLALAADAGASGFVYESAPDAIYRAAKSQTLLTLTSDVLTARLEEHHDATRGYIEIDNASGGYGGPPATIAIGNLLSISWGYRTASGLQSSKMADVWIAAYEYRRTGGVSTLRLHVEGGWETLRRNRQRTQIVHTGGETYQQVLIRILSRAGLHLSSSAPSSRATSVTPKFTVHPHTSGFEAVQQALAFLADRIRMSTIASAVLTEPLASAASDYTYGTTHPLRDVHLRSEPPLVVEAQAFGSGAFGDAVDFVTAAAGQGTREQQRDITSATGAGAAATAVAHLRRRALDAPSGRVMVPPNCGQELLDVVDFTDALIAPTAIKRRVTSIRWAYDRRRAVYEQELELGVM
ncbi:MAG: hypothetical protein M3P30_02640 [Chloroflexota bacterium]|nr:hypothetical protein [Chloroflexota bacterium]